MSNDKGARFRDSSSDRVPYKPTREAANSSEAFDEVTRQRSTPTGMDAGDELGDSRHEQGSRAASKKHPPHSTTNDDRAPVQDDLPADDDVPVLPANAGGSDAIGTDQQDEPVDDESMYDRRPERDKDEPPSRRVR